MPYMTGYKTMLYTASACVCVSNFTGVDDCYIVDHMILQYIYTYTI